MNDLRLEEFELPPIGEDEILARVVSDSICMSSHKAAAQGAGHKRVPDDVAGNPVIIGHEFCGELIEIGAKWRGRFKPGQKFSIQPALNYKGSLDAPGYSYRYIGGDASYVVIPNEVMELDCLLDYGGEAYFYGSLSEPMSCIIGAFHACYHTQSGSYTHKMGTEPGGRLALLAAAGPMGLGAIDYAISCENKPSLIAVTDIDGERLKRAERLLPPEKAAARGVRLIYAMTADPGELMGFTGGRGYDDVFVFAPAAPVIELADGILSRDGCLNFFAGPVDPRFFAPLNFYNVHYASTHVVGTSGGNTDDMREALALMEKGLIDPAAMITHVGGLDAAAGATLGLDKLPGGKKLIYTHIDMPLTAIADFERLGRANGMNGPDAGLYAELAEIVAANNGLWCAGAEKALLRHFNV